MSFTTQFRKDGFHEQYMRNMLHIRQEDDFIEIGQLAGVSNTDWSWAALFADFDLDGYKDLMVTNGYLRDYTDLDFLRTTLPEAYIAASAQGKGLSALEMVQHMPSTRIPNYIFRGQDGLTFADYTTIWGFNQPTHSNGAAWADLDGDLDLDLIINNINTPAYLYRNEAQRQRGVHALKVVLEGPSGNAMGIGTKVIVRGTGYKSMQELQPVRGYLSSVEPILVFGTGALRSVDVDVVWPDGREQTIESVQTGQTLTIRYEDASPSAPVAVSSPVVTLFRRHVQSGLNYIHKENPFVDYERQPLLPHLLSREGPALVSGDLNRDGLTDVFVGGHTVNPQLFTCNNPEVIS